MVSPGQGGDVTLIRTGAHKVTIDPTPGVNTVVGFTQGNLQLSFSVNKRQVMVAEYGSTPVDERVTGVQLSVRFSLPETSIKTLKIAFQGLYPGAPSGGVGIGRSGIISAQTYGKKILLHPVAEGSATTYDITLNKVMLTPTGNVELSDQGERVYEVEGTCVVDPSGTDGTLLAQILTPDAGV